jgi:chorismate mutase
VDNSQAQKLLNDSRKEIDAIDEQIIDLIQTRTSLAKDIARAKLVLKKDIEDVEREDYIQHKIKVIAKKRNLNEVSLTQIMKILTDLNKYEQKKFLRR